MAYQRIIRTTWKGGSDGVILNILLFEGSFQAPWRLSGLAE